MANSRCRNHPPLILAPPPSPLVASHAQFRPGSLDSIQISHKEGLRLRQVKNQRRLLQLFPSTPMMNPLLSGQAPPDLPLAVFSRASSRSEYPTSRPPRERMPRTGNLPTNHHPCPRRRAASNWEKRAGCSPSAAEPTFPSPSSISRPSDEWTDSRIEVTEPLNLKRISGESFLPIPAPSSDPQRSPRTPRNRATLRRRITVDSSSTPNRITLAGGVEPKEDTITRSRSLRTREKESSTIENHPLDDETPFSHVNPSPGPLAEKQRVMNVRRAKKMQQLFGSEPPQTLFQVAHTNPISDVESDHAEGFDKRNSMSTLLSISTTGLLSPQPLSARQRRGSASSTIILSTPTTPILSQPETPESVLPRFEQSFTHTASTASPPFSHMFHPSTRMTATTPEASKSAARAESTGRHKEKDFKKRRMRAAKLSKFFGVRYQDLEPHLVPAPVKSRTDVRKVEVAIDARGGLPWDRHEVRSLDMEDVIVRLRDLRSS